MTRTGDTSGTAMRAGRGLALVAASAVLFGLAFPPLRLRALAWIALAPLFVALRLARSTRAALALAALWSLGAAWVVGDWMPGAIETYYLQPRAVGFAFFVGISLFTGGLYYMAFAAALRALVRRHAVSAPIWTALAWVAAELGRGRLLTGTPLFVGNPWALVGYSQAGVLPLLQLASLGGVYLVGFCIAFVNAAVAELWLGTLGRGGRALDRRAFVRIATPPALVVAAAYGFGGLVLARAPATADDDPAMVPIAIVQPNLAIGAHWRPELYGRHLGAYLDLTREALASQPAPRVVFWPESAMAFFVEQESTYRDVIARALAPSGAQLVAGAPRSAGGGAPPFWNSVYAIAPDGRFLGRYDKELLVPFGETFPLGSIELLRRRFGPAREFTPGRGGPPLPTAAGALGVLVCNEAMLPEVAAARVAAGATVLVNPSNDSWIPARKFAEQQFDIVALRAVEQRRFLVRASTSGPSAIVDPYGRVRVAGALFAPAVLRGSVRAERERSVYGVIGDTFAAGCAVAVLVALAWRIRSERGMVRRGGE